MSLTKIDNVFKPDFKVYHFFKDYDCLLKIFKYCMSIVYRERLSFYHNLGEKYIIRVSHVKHVLATSIREEKLNYNKLEFIIKFLLTSDDRSEKKDHIQDISNYFRKIDHVDKLETISLLILKNPLLRGQFDTMKYTEILIKACCAAFRSIYTKDFNKNAHVDFINTLNHNKPNNWIDFPVISAYQAVQLMETFNEQSIQKGAQQVQNIKTLAFQILGSVPKSPWDGIQDIFEGLKMLRNRPLEILQDDQKMRACLKIIELLEKKVLETQSLKNPIQGNILKEIANLSAPIHEYKILKEQLDDSAKMQVVGASDLLAIANQIQKVANQMQICSLSRWKSVQEVLVWLSKLTSDVDQIDICKEVTNQTIATICDQYLCTIERGKNEIGSKLSLPNNIKELVIIKLDQLKTYLRDLKQGKFVEKKIDAIEIKPYLKEYAHDTYLSYKNVQDGKANEKASKDFIDEDKRAYASNGILRERYKHIIQDALWQEIDSCCQNKEQLTRFLLSCKNLDVKQTFTRVIKLHFIAVFNKESVSKSEVDQIHRLILRQVAYCVWQAMQEESSAAEALLTLYIYLSILTGPTLQSLRDVLVDLLFESSKENMRLNVLTKQAHVLPKTEKNFRRWYSSEIEYQGLLDYFSNHFSVQHELPKFKQYTKDLSYQYLKAVNRNGRLEECAKKIKAFAQLKIKNNQQKKRCHMPPQYIHCTLKRETLLKLSEGVNSFSDVYQGAYVSTWPEIEYGSFGIAFNAKLIGGNIHPLYHPKTQEKHIETLVNQVKRDAQQKTQSNQVYNMELSQEDQTMLTYSGDRQIEPSGYHTNKQADWIACPSFNVKKNANTPYQLVEAVFIDQLQENDIQNLSEKFEIDRACVLDLATFILISAWMNKVHVMQRPSFWKHAYKKSYCKMKQFSDIKVLSGTGKKLKEQLLEIKCNSNQIHSIGYAGRHGVLIIESPNVPSLLFNKQCKILQRYRQEQVRSKLLKFVPDMEKTLSIKL